MSSLVHPALAAVLFVFAAAAGSADAQGYPGYPYTIMTPERSAAGHDHRTVSRRERSPSAIAHGIPQPKGHARVAARGSSGVVLPTPLPRTQLIPPEGTGTITTLASPRQQGPTNVPSAPSLGAIPNLPHGPETFQDRASRCAFQSGLYGVPGSANSQYMAACVQ